MPGRVPARRQPPARRHPAGLAGCDTPGDQADRGAVTVEAALALCSLALFLALAIGAITAVGASVRCVDAARELARLAARGEPDRGHAVAAQLAPAGADVSLARDGDLVVADVSAALLRPLPLRVGGHAVAALEPAVIDP